MKKTLLFLSITICGIANADSWTQKASLATGRWQAFGFSIGIKGYIGVGNSGSADLTDFWEWDQGTNVWTQKATFPQSLGFDQSSAFSIGTKGYAGTGQSTSAVTNLFYEWNQATNTWAAKTNFGGTARKEAVGFVVGGIGYIGTGCNVTQSTFYKDSWQYNAGPNTWTQKATFTGAARYGAMGFAIGNFGYIGGGSGSTGNYQDFYEWNQSTNVWTQKANYPIASANRNGIGFAIGTMGYFGTGGAYLQDFYQWNQATNIWTQKANFGGAGRIGAVAFSIGSKGYIGTGNDGINKYADLWEYDSTGVTAVNENILYNSLLVYPNPITTQATFTLNNEVKSASLKIYDVNGKEVKQIIFSGRQLFFERKNLESGVYFYQITSEEKNIATGKLIIE